MDTRKDVETVEGEFYFKGNIVLTALDEAAIAELGVGRKFQKPTVFENHTVFENLEVLNIVSDALHYRFLFASSKIFRFLSRS